MPIDYEKILRNKTGPVIKNKFESLTENSNIADILEYRNYVRNLPLEQILEHSKYIYGESKSGSDFFLSVIRSNELTPNQLKTQKEGLNNFLNQFNNTKKISPDHMKSITECVDNIDNLISLYESNDYIKEDIKYQLNNNVPNVNYKTDIETNLDYLIRNINYDPQVSLLFVDVLRQINTFKNNETMKNTEMLLSKNTSLILSLNIDLSEDTIETIFSLPLLVINKLIEEKITNKFGNIVISLLDKQIRLLQNQKNVTKENKDMTLIYENYIIILQDCKQRLQLYLSDKPVKENVSTMNPIPVTSTENGSLTVEEVDDILDHLEHELNSSFVDFCFEECMMDNELIPKFNNIISTTEKYYKYVIYQLWKLLDDIDSMDDCCGNNDNKFREIVYTIQRKRFNIMTEEEVDELYDMFYPKTNSDLDSLTEAAKDTLRKGALKVEKGAQGAMHSVRKFQSNAKHVTVAVKKAAGHVDNFVNSTLDSIKKMDKDERRKRIVEGTLRVKLFRIIRNAIGLRVLWAINPAIAAVTLITGFAIDEHLDNKVRRELLHELETELKICEEKIEDARINSDKQAKYQLIRLKNKMESDITRIKYRLD
jgi:hypothetical protein